MGLPEHWKIETLGKFCRVFSGFAFKRSDYTKGGIPLIKIGNLQDGIVIVSPDNDYVLESWRQKEELRRFTLKSGDILIALTGKTGKTAVVSPSLEGALLNQRVGKIELTSPEIEQGFILAITKTGFFQEAIRQNTFRSVQGNISPSSIAQITIPVPPLAEQRAIASVLDAIQETKFARQKEIALERERKAALMESVFSHGTKGESRKQTEIGEIPESWKVVRLEEVVRKSIKDGVHQTPTYVEDGVPFITAKDIVGNKICFASCAYISVEEHTILSKRVKPEVGDVLLTKVGTVGNVALVDTIRQFSIFVQLALIKPKSDKIDSGFLFYALESDMGQKEINRNCAQSTMRFIGVQKIANVRVPLPSLFEQVEIATTLQACDTKIAALEQESTHLEELFHAMLEELMTGQRSAVPLIDAELSN